MTNHRLEVLGSLADEIAARRSAAPDQSYTAKLLSGGAETCARKLGEEAIETVLAAMSDDRRHLASESADLLYHLLVLLEARQVPLADVMAELARRQGVSGLAEKAARSGDRG
jgi:phosphoribosyl-ATP pyrophosphohydrolase